MTFQDQDHVPLPADRGHGLRVWVLFLAGPTLWFTHFILVYVLAEVLCKPFDGAAEALPQRALSTFTIATTIAFALAAAGVAFLAYRQWRADRADARDDAGETERAAAQGETLLFAGALLGVLFSVAVVLTGAPAVVLQPC